MSDEHKAAVAELLEHRRSAKVSRLASPGDPTLENGVPQ
jgi:hypothetical protein